jgi:hypothetical protein
MLGDGGVMLSFALCGLGPAYAKPKPSVRHCSDDLLKIVSRDCRNRAGYGS